MTETAGKHQTKNGGKFPVCMELVNDVFYFQHDEADSISLRFHCVNDVVRQLETAITEISEADLRDDGDARAIIGLLREELEVIGFSLSARGSIVRL